MHWYTLAFISVFSIAIASLLQKVLMTEEETDPLAYSIIFQFVLGTIFLVYALIQGFILPDFSRYWSFILFSTVFWGLSTLMSFKAIKYLGASDLAIIASSSIIISIIASLWFLGEKINGGQILGVFLILISVYLVNSGFQKKLQGWGIVFGLLAALFGGLAVTSDVYVLRTTDLNSYLAVISYTPGIFLLLFLTKKLKALKQFFKISQIKLMLIFCAFYATQAITYFLAIKQGASLSQMSPISKSSIVLTVVLSIIFLKEKNNIFNKLFATVLVTAGVFLLG